MYLTKILFKLLDFSQITYIQTFLVIILIMRIIFIRIFKFFISKKLVKEIINYIIKILNFNKILFYFLDYITIEIRYLELLI